MTLIELLTVMSLVGILLAIGVPSYKYVTTSNRVSAEVNALLSDMQFARSEAQKEGQMVTVCPSAAQNQCDVNSTNWHNGWIVFSDVNGNQQIANPAANYLLRTQKADGTWFVELAPLADAPQVVPTVAQVLGHPIAQRETALASLVRPRR